MFIYMVFFFVNILDYLEKYKNVFLECYGYEREVFFLEMLCFSIGIGVFVMYMNFVNEFFEEILFGE